MHTDDIYSRLLAGEEADAIAREFTDALNAAQTHFAEEAARKAEEEAKAAMKESMAQAKREDMVLLVRDALSFIAKYYPSFGISTEDLAEELDDETVYSIADLLLLIIDLEAIKQSKPSFKSAGRRAKLPVVDEAAPVSTKDIFADAFKMFGL